VGGSRMIQSQCHVCCHKKVIISGKGSRFLLCELSQTDQRFAKYPPQPIIRFARTGCPADVTVDLTPNEIEFQ
jgi:hypothetical protein